MMPSHARSLADAWGFEPDEELPRGHCSRIFADSTRVLKVPFQGEELTYGAATAVKLQAVGGPEILAHDRETGIVLMRRLSPGIHLAEACLDESDAQSVFAGLAIGIARLDPEAAMTIRDYLAVDHPLLDRLEATADTRCFLHGDLHHYNILADGDVWRPIDPKGLFGDPHYECVAFLRNPIEVLRRVDDLVAFTRPRIESLAKRLGLDPWRIVAWGFVDGLDNDGPPEDPWCRLHDAYAQLLTSTGGSG
ncbi:MAG TPA: aminoglycoside phosphotransferase family protein [Fimbriimonadaceae bacterium]|nr:aminoglycoside phosphotransferase family protein [Fimbriimonadaceae bacterium]